MTNIVNNFFSINKVGFVFYIEPSKINDQYMAWYINLFTYLYTDIKIFDIVVQINTNKYSVESYIKEICRKINNINDSFKPPNKTIKFI